MSLDDLIAKVRSLKGVKLKAGVLGAYYVDTKQSVAQVALWNEYGTANIPSRPFMRNAVRDNSSKWMAEAFGGINAYLKDGEPLENVTNHVGAMMQADIQASIESNTPPPNKRSTLRRKSRRVVDRYGKPIEGDSGTKQTLIDTGTLFDAISFEVEK